MAHIEFEYKNDTPKYELDYQPKVNIMNPSFVFEVEGAKGRSRKIALLDYVNNIQMGYKEVINMFESDIKSFKIPVGTLMHIMNSSDSEDMVLTKTEDDIFFSNKGNQIINEDIKYNLYVFNIFGDCFKEGKYIDKDKVLDLQKNFNSAVDKVLPDMVSDRKGANIEFKNNPATKRGSYTNDELEKLFIPLVVCLHKFIPNYNIVMDKKTNTIRYMRNGEYLDSIDDIPENDDDVYVFLKFVEYVFLGKLHETEQNHLSVIFIDGDVLSLNVYSAFLYFIRLLYKNNAVLYIYNVDSKGKNAEGLTKKDMAIKVGCKHLVLPNHKLAKNNSDKEIYKTVK